LLVFVVFCLQAFDVLFSPNPSSFVFISHDLFQLQYYIWVACSIIDF
jgi:hypothetical protein